MYDDDSSMSVCHWMNFHQNWSEILMHICQSHGLVLFGSLHASKRIKHIERPFFFLISISFLPDVHLPKGVFKNVISPECKLQRSSTSLSRIRDDRFEILLLCIKINQTRLFQQGCHIAFQKMRPVSEISIYQILVPLCKPANDSLFDIMLSSVLWVHGLV